MPGFAMRPRNLPMKRSVGCLLYSEVPKKLQHQSWSAAARRVVVAIFSSTVRTSVHQAGFLICTGTAAEKGRRVGARQDSLQLRRAEGFEHSRSDRIRAAIARFMVTRRGGQLRGHRTARNRTCEQCSEPNHGPLQLFVRRLDAHQLNPTTRMASCETA